MVVNDNSLIGFLNENDSVVVLEGGNFEVLGNTEFLVKYASEIVDYIEENDGYKIFLSDNRVITIEAF